MQPFAWLVCSYFVVALVLGGSSADPVFADFVRLLAAPVVALAVWRMVHHPVARGAVIPVAILVAALVLIVLQLVPLPPSVWCNLPGRQALAEIYPAAGLAFPWLPISLTPDATRSAALGLLPPAAMLLSTLTLNDRSRRLVAIAALGVALLSIGLGMLQLVGGSQSAFRLYSHTDTAAAVGFFANRNHQGTFLASCVALAGMVAATRPTPNGPPRFLWIAFACALATVFIVGAAVTRSRAAVILMAPGLLGFIAVAARGVRTDPEPGRRWMAAIVLAAILLIGGTLLVAFNFAPLSSRFDTAIGTDLRFQLAPTIVDAGWRFAPTGTGIGSFDEVYPMLEDSQRLTNAAVNHAHNDYLEVWLEAAWAGIVLIAAFLLWWGGATWRLLSETGRHVSAGLAGSAVILVMIIHSTVDYPLRTSALACLAAFAIGLMTRSGSKPRLARSQSTDRQNKVSGLVDLGEPLQ